MHIGSCVGVPSRREIGRQDMVGVRRESFEL